MKVAKLETLFCDAGWRPWIFVKATTIDGLVGWSEVTDSHGSVHGIDALTVADASIMPTIPTATTNLPTIMLAEHIARELRNT